MKILFITAMILIATNSIAQKEDLIKYLESYKTSEFEESKKVISEYSFDNEEVEYTMSEYSSINGLIFTTDIPAVKGYKAIMNCKLQAKSGTFIEKRMMVIMYYDKIKKHWSVLKIREPVETNNEYQLGKKSVEGGGLGSGRELDYGWLSFWAMMAGQIKDARKYVDIAILASKETTNHSPFTTRIDLVLKRIL